MSPVVAVIAPGMMGSAVGKRLMERGLQGHHGAGRAQPGERSRAPRGGRHGWRSDEAEAVKADIVMSIVPPAAALPLAERLLPVLQGTRQKPIYRRLQRGPSQHGRDASQR